MMCPNLDSKLRHEDFEKEDHQSIMDMKTLVKTPFYIITKKAQWCSHLKKKNTQDINIILSLSFLVRLKKQPSF